MPKGRPRKLDDPTDLLHDYENGVPMKDMVVKYGVSDTTIQSYAKQAGVPRRSPWRPKRQRDRWAYIRNLCTRHGITPEDFLRLYRGSRGRCDICGSKIRVRNREKQGTLYVDHCHKTGRVRGVLCAACNTGIGNLGDSPQRLRKAYRYLLER